MIPGALIAASILSCGRFKKDEDDRTVTPASQLDTNLVGTWENDCEKADFIGLQYRRVKFKFETGLGFVREQSVYTDAACAGERYTDKQIGTWASVGEAKETQDARQINLTVVDSYVTPSNKDVAAEFNKLGYCGASDWAEKVTKKVTSVKCASAMASGQVIFDIYRVKDKVVYFGKSGLFLTGKSDGSRPKEIETAKPHHKK